MPATLIIPGVQVRTEFEPAPVLPGATGILGVIGIVDRGPVIPTPIGSFGEFIDIFGPASRYSMPEVRTALANGVAQVVIARVAPGRGLKASLDLTNDAGNKVATLEARAEGAWAGHLAVRVTQVKTLSGKGVKYVNLVVTFDGQVVETHNNLVMDHTSPDYFFDRINRQSRVLIAIDPAFQKELPRAMAKTALADAGSRAAAATLKASNADVVQMTAKQAGEAGNLVSVQVNDGRAALTLLAADNSPAVDVVARQAGTAGATTLVTVAPAAPNSVNLTVAAPGGSPRVLGPFLTVAAIVAGLANDPDVSAVALGNALPAVIGATTLKRRVDLLVFLEGQDTNTYAGLANLDAIAALNDPSVRIEKAAGATQLPDAVDGVRLAGGRDAGPALLLTGSGSSDPLLEIVPAPGVTDPVAIVITSGTSSIDGATPVVNLQVFVGDELAESWANLTMDPDDPGYLVAMLNGSAFVRAFDLGIRTRTISFPRSVSKAQKLDGGSTPGVDDFQAALDQLEGAETVDLVIASVNNQLNTADSRTVQQAVVAHCTKMADVARNRIGIGSVSVNETKVEDVLDHADDVRSDHFVLVAPSGGEAALAGLLGRQDYFQSPTFKTIASLGVEPGHYTDAQLTQLILGNVLVINEKARLGIIVMKGLLTSGRQVNVQRTANKAVREVKAIADKYIGLLNNEGTRNALRQQIIALFLQMERDGALVPSTDGKDPAFKVDVYSTQADFANGIVRVDIAVRPVRAIDYVYATILVKN